MRICSGICGMWLSPRVWRKANSIRRRRRLNQPALRYSSRRNHVARISCSFRCRSASFSRYLRWTFSQSSMSSPSRSTVRLSWSSAFTRFKKFLKVILIFQPPSKIFAKKVVVLQRKLFNQCAENRSILIKSILNCFKNNERILKKVLKNPCTRFSK